MDKEIIKKARKILWDKYDEQVSVGLIITHPQFLRLDLALECLENAMKDIKENRDE